MRQGGRKQAEEIIKELRNNNPYPEDIFIQKINDVKYWKRVTDALKAKKITPDSVFGCWGRQVWNNCIDELEKLQREND